MDRDSKLSPRSAEGYTELSSLADVEIITLATKCVVDPKRLEIIPQSLH
jgi:hypothetical protein